MNVYLSVFLRSKIKPIGQFSNDRAISDRKIQTIRRIIVSIHQEEIRNRLKAPLKAGVDVEVVQLIIVLNEGRQEDVAGKGQFNARANQKKVYSGIPASGQIGQLDLVVIISNCQGAKWLDSIGQATGNTIAFPIEILTGIGPGEEEKSFSLVRVIGSRHIEIRIVSALW